jgi:8-oxo-dGTP pyrophosphatase MutT (NUDIX family)
MAQAPSNILRQAAALPLRGGRVCLVLSNSGKRWVIPKGCIERGQTATETALQEAWEEAGLMGVLRPQPVGSYAYAKNGHACHVTVFMLDVIEISQEWPERERRARQWFRPQRALTRITDEGLRRLMRQVLRSGVWTDANGAEQTPSWRRLGLNPLFQGFMPVPVYGMPLHSRRESRREERSDF